MKNTVENIDQTKIIFPNEDLKASISTGKTPVLSTTRGLHPEIEIKYFYEGTSALMVDNDTIITQAGDIVIINPYEIHSTINIDGAKGKYHLFMISLDFFATGNASDFDLRHLLVGRQLCFKHLIRDNKRLQAILSQVVEEMAEKEENYQFVVRGLLLEFFALLLRKEVEPRQSNIERAEAIKYYTFIEPALQKIRKDYAEKLTVSELAELCNLSKSHFCRTFKLVMNATVVQYISDYRFKIANLLLMDSNNSMAEIAVSCGFGDEAYFSRCYKNKYGISPNKKKVILSKKQSI